MLQNKFVGGNDNRYITENSHIQSFDFMFCKWTFLDFYAANCHPLA